MTSWRSGRLLLVLAVALAGLGGCSDGDEAATEQPGSTNSYVLLSDDAWMLQEAVDPPADDPATSVERPPVAWYAEYVQTSAAGSRMVRLSGHLATFDETRAELQGLGFALAAVDVARWEAEGSTAADDSVVVLVLRHGSAAVIALSYELSLGELVALAANIEPASEAAWVDAGGVIR